MECGSRNFPEHPGSPLSARKNDAESEFVMLYLPSS